MVTFPTKLSRHDYHKDKEIPYNQSLIINLVGGEIIDIIVPGKYKFIMDEGYFHIYDPMGFGIVRSIERGIIRDIEIDAVGEGKWSKS